MIGKEIIIKFRDRNLETQITASQLISVEIKNITHDETARLFGGITGHAGIFATAPDLIKFAKLWLKNDTLKELAFQNYNLTGKLSQGLGWWGRIPDNPTNQTPSLNTPGI
jgi:CubicO group peptidase (beta-lactamase class C family)